MAHRSCSIALLAPALLCMCAVFCGAAPVVVPAGMAAPTPASGEPAKWQSLYPNSEVRHSTEWSGQMVMLQHAAVGEWVMAAF